MNNSPGTPGTAKGVLNMQLQKSRCFGRAPTTLWSEWTSLMMRETDYR